MILTTFRETAASSQSIITPTSSWASALAAGISRACSISDQVIEPVSMVPHRVLLAAR